MLVGPKVFVLSLETKKKQRYRVQKFHHSTLAIISISETVLVQNSRLLRLSGEAHRVQQGRGHPQAGQGQPGQVRRQSGGTQ